MPAVTREPLFGRRLAVVYDVNGPRVRLGVLWIAAVAAALQVGPAGVAAVYAAAAGLAGWQTLEAWKSRRSDANQWVGAAGAALLPLAAVVSAQLLGAAILVLAFLAVAVTLAAPGKADRAHVLAAAGLTVQSTLFVGLAGASIVLAIRLDIAAAVVLVLFVAAYEVGDFLVGSGAGNAWEGPAAGIAAIAALGLCAAVLRVAPFDGADVWTFAALAAVACPLGQVAASVLLPAADAHAPALRRLDSLLVLGPAWAALIGLYLSRVA